MLHHCNKTCLLNISVNLRYFSQFISSNQSTSFVGSSVLIGSFSCTNTKIVLNSFLTTRPGENLVYPFDSLVIFFFMPLTKLDMFSLVYIRLNEVVSHVYGKLSI